MCGIAGYVGAGGPGVLAAMLRALKHRGPDDDGLRVDPAAAVGLGMTRLAIIDPETGRQPMATADDTAWLVFNGEIYNFRALRATLEARGRRFATRSDTEVLLAAWEAWDAACVDRLRGMFAFALWDRRRRRLLLARDRLGKKPLYYWQRGAVLVFASELKALLVHPAVSRALDPAALHHYLAFGYTPGDRAIFAGIAKLPPGHTAVFAEGRLTLARYWAPPPGPAATAARVPDAEAPALVRAALGDAVRARLEADVPLGVFLSGGIDSSVVVAAAREVHGGPLATFTVGFGAAAPGYDELPAARLVARHFATDHHEERVEPAVAAALPAIVAAFDEPFADSSAVATWAVARATARHVRVALSGLGGDETFGGYPRYLGLRLSEAWRRLPRPLRWSAAAAARALRESEASPDWGGRLRRFVAHAERPLPDRYLAWTRLFAEDDLARLATPALRALLGGPVDGPQRAAFASAGHDDPVDGAMRVDLATYLPDDLLVMADRLGMAHALEVRAPFCDPLVVELSLRIAPATKLPGLALKGLLKRAYADVLPAPTLARRKQGFMIPLARWLRTDLAPLVADRLAPARVRARGLFDPAAVTELVRALHAGRAGHADRVWALLILELWLEQYLDQGAPWRLG